MSGMEIKPKPCPFCGVDVNFTSDSYIFGWHEDDCFFAVLDEHEVTMTEEEIKNTFIDAWNRRAYERID